MSRTLNRVEFIGNVGREPDIQQTQHGTKIAHLSLATARYVPTHDLEGRERTDWHRLTCYNRLAQFVEDHVTTGDRLFVEGRLEYDSYERDGVTIPTAEIVVTNIMMLTPKAGI